MARISIFKRYNFTWDSRTLSFVSSDPRRQDDFGRSFVGTLALVLLGTPECYVLFRSACQFCFEATVGGGVLVIQAALVLIWGVTGFLPISDYPDGVFEGPSRPNSFMVEGRPGCLLGSKHYPVPLFL